MNKWEILELCLLAIALISSVSVLLYVILFASAILKETKYEVLSPSIAVNSLDGYGSRHNNQLQRSTATDCYGS
jgi:hypothetical protein